MVEKKSFWVQTKNSDDEPGAFEGVLSTYGNVDLVGDICEKGCFDESLAKDGSRRVFLWQHDVTQPIGSFEAFSDDSALRIKGKFNLEVAKAKEAYALLKAGDINGLSIGYTADDYDYDREGVRHLRKVKLLEGSLVTFPANELASASAKCIERKARIMKYAQMKSLEGLDEDTRKNILKELAELAEETSEDAPVQTEEDESKADDSAEDSESEDQTEEEKSDDESEDQTDDIKADLIEDLKTTLKKLLEEL